MIIIRIVGEKVAMEGERRETPSRSGGPEEESEDNREAVGRVFGDCGRM